MTSIPPREDTDRMDGPHVVNDSTSRAEIIDILERSYRPRLHNPLTDESSTDNLHNLRESWRAEEITTVFTSGVFDFLHLNQRAYLLHTKLAAAPYHYERFVRRGDERAWDELSELEQNEHALRFLSEGRIRLIVSIDGNMAVMVRKGWNPAKGNGPRPIYDWETRAREVLSVAVETEPGHLVSIADGVTMHDKEEAALKNTPHQGIMDIAAFVEPEVWSVYFESDDILEAVETSHAEQFKAVTVTRLIEKDFYSDKLLGGAFSTTFIAQRIGTTALK